MREYDVVVFGASGFTGARVVQYAGVHCSSLKVAVAGRDERRLQQVVERFGVASMSVLPNVDVFNPASLVEMAQKTRMVLACVGPYRLYGEPVVKACVDAGTDYMDVSGEPEFMEAMQLKYNDLAKAKGVFIVSAVGFDCIPCEVGAYACMQAMLSKRVTPHSIQSYLHLTYGPAGAVANFGTYESAVLGFHNLQKLKQIRRQAAAKKLNPSPAIAGPKPPAMKNSPTWLERYRGWILPFPGADASVVRRTMSLYGTKGKPAAHYLAWVVVKSPVNLALYVALGAVCSALAQFAWGVSLLLRFPGAFSAGMFSRRGPREEQIQGAGFNMVLEGYGTREGKTLLERAVTVRVKGPEPGYSTTPITLVESALELLEARAQIVAALGPGGVFTPGSLLLHGDGLLQRLRSRGITIDEELS